jgi:hypothetical protein
MRKQTMTLHHTLRSAIAIALIAMTACSDEPAPTVDAAPPDGGPSGPTFRQVEHLARPGINEALLLSEGFLAGYNATAPSFTGVPTDTLNAVVAQAKTVLQALYLGGCLLNGVPEVASAGGLKPAGLTCHAVGGGIWTENNLNGVTLTADSKTYAAAYADKVFGQFIPDVMRVDTGVDSNYLTLCGDAESKPLLCGGRFLNEDTIDITFNYLLNGAGTGNGPFNQIRALTGDGVAFSDDDAGNSGNVSDPDPRNPSQFHRAVSTTFPYSAAPF